MFKIKTRVGNFILVSGNGRVRLVDEDYADIYKTAADARKCVKRLAEWCGFENADLIIVKTR